MPDDDVYMPLHVGREGKGDLGYIGDNTGDNISSKNANYCELTGLYWAWKNLKCDYIGLCHYRRYFGKKGKFITYIREEKERVFKKKDYEERLCDCDVLLPKAMNFDGMTIGEHYRQYHYWKDLEKTRLVLEKEYPTYVKSFDLVMNSNRGYFANMFVTNKSIFDSYCEWLFNILFKIEKENDLSAYDSYQARIYGFLSERLFNVFLHKQNFKILEADVLMIEENVKKKKIICRNIFKHLGI